MSVVLILINLINLVCAMSVLVDRMRELVFEAPYWSVSLRDVKGFLHAISQGELTYAAEQLEEFKKAGNLSPQIWTELRHAEALLEMQLFYAGIKITPPALWKEEEAEFLSSFSRHLDLPCPEIRRTFDQTIRYLRMKKISEEVSSAVLDLQLFSKKVVDWQKSGVQLCPGDLSQARQELSTLKSRFNGFKWSGQERVQTQIGKLERALPTLEADCGINLLGRIYSTLLSSVPRALAATPPIGIPNEGNSCFLASAIHLILKDPVLEEALIQEWMDGGPAREFGEFIFNYREAQKSGQATLAGIGKLRDALCRLSGNDEFRLGQWDANEVLRTLVSDELSPLFQRLQQRGYFIEESVRRYYEPPAGCTPLEGKDLLQDPETGLYYSERKVLRPAQIEVEVSASDRGTRMGDLIARVWHVSLEGSEPGNYPMRDGQELPCKPLFQKTEWSYPVPDRITVSLKRWAYAGAEVKVDAPIAVSEIEQIQVGNEQVAMRLAGFTLHSGNTGGGHWISYTAENGRYTCNNDSRISSISREEFLFHAQKASDFSYEKVR